MAQELEQLPDWGLHKHPLTYVWVLWYSDRSIAKAWHECIKEVGSFDTVEDFWCLFNFLKPVSLLKAGCDFYLFKKGIQPMWEDKANKQGGRWDITFERGFYNQPSVDNYWMELVMTMIGDRLVDLGEMVTGVCVSKRDKNSRISIWTSVANESDKLVRLGMKIKQMMAIPSEHSISFRAHEDSVKSRPINLLHC